MLCDVQTTDNGRDVTVNQEELPRNLIVDFDGTITEKKPYKGMHIYENLQPKSRDVLKMAKHNGFSITIFTARSWMELDSIKKFLDTNHVPYDHVVCGKPIGCIYIDDRANGGFSWDHVHDMVMNYDEIYKEPVQEDSGNTDN